MSAWWKRPRLWSMVVIAAAAVAIVVLVVLYRAMGWSLADQFASTVGPPVAIVSMAGPLVVSLWRKGSPTSGPSDQDLGRVMESLALAQEHQWAAEELAQKVTDPWPLPVRWEVTERALAVMANWPSIRGRAGAGPLSLGGTFYQIADVFTHPDSPRRLVVLGEPGAGKSMLALRLTLDMLDRRAAGEPVPVLLSVATWDPAEPLDEWIAARLAADHHELASPVRAADGRRRTLARELVDSSRILPVLDGLDEMADEHHRSALIAAADTLIPGRQIVLTSRTAEYEIATADGELARTPVVEIMPLSRSDAANYLTESTEQPERWAPVLKYLGTTGGRALAQALSTPLMLSLARTVYHGRDSRPDELITAEWAHERAGIEDHLLAALLPVAYTNPVGSQPRLDRQKADRAQRWLANIALHLHTRGEPSLAWWELRSATAAAPWLITATLVVIWLATAAHDKTNLFLLETPVVATMLLTTIRAPRPRQISLSLNGRRMARLAVALPIGIVAGLSSGRFPDALVIPIVAVALWFVLENVIFASDGPIGSVVTAVDASRAVSPLSVLRRDRRFALSLLSSVSFGILACMAAVSVFSPPSRTVPTGPAHTVIIIWLLVILVVVAFSLIVGVVVGLGFSAWGQFCVVRLLLAVQGRTPLRLMTFLKDAHRRGILRQAGGVYQFRHSMLQQQLARTAEARRHSSAGPDRPHRRRNATIKSRS